VAFVPEGQHDRSQARSARESVPRKYRPLGYGMIGRSQSQRYFSWKRASCRIGAHTCTNHTVPYGTALWVGAVPGTSCRATISLSLRDKSHSPIEGPGIPRLSSRAPSGHGTKCREHRFPGLRATPIFLLRRSFARPAPGITEPC
jgi:hypothetical protein